MRIDPRFCGPSDSANGGYTCGRVAALLGAGDAEVTLRLPPPLGVDLSSERSASGVVVRFGDRVVAEGVPTLLDVEPPPPVDFATATEASKRYPWAHGHPYPRCFVCGPERTAGDGLLVFPGAVEGRDVAAAPWVPDASVGDADGLVRPEIVWAALDCPSWFGLHCFHPWKGGAILLGRLAAHVAKRPRVGERCVAVGWFIGRDGRKMHCGSAIYSERGEPYGVARATWIAPR